MTFPGADTIKGGIMGEDCFLFKAGVPFFSIFATVGNSDASCADIVSTGDCSGVCVEWVEVVRC
jgi:hypothetical protein